jgi:hypothetical protein
MHVSSLMVALILRAAGHFTYAVAESPVTFSATGGLMRPRANHTATLLTDGKVLIAGGTQDYVTPTATAELYDPQTREFTRTGDMITPRVAHTATLLPDGRVLMAGGTTFAGVGLVGSSSAEIYDPATGIFAPTVNMISKHVCQQAHLLANGKVLIVGGSDGTGGDAEAEVFDSATNTFAATGVTVRVGNTCQGSVLALLPDSRVLVISEEFGVGGIYDPVSGAFALTAYPMAGVYNDGMPSATLLM